MPLRRGGAKAARYMLAPVISASVPPPSRSVEGNGSLVLKFGAWIGLAAAGALLCTVPAMLRVSEALAGGAPVVRAWAALGAAALGPMGLSIVVLRGARRGLRAFGGPPHLAQLRWFGLGLWLALLFVTLASFGSVLRATTHHRALAGVTYGCGALVVAVVWGLVCARIVAMLRSVSVGLQRFVVFSLGGAVFATVAFVLQRFVSVVSTAPSASGAKATVIDVFAFLLTAIFVSLDWRAATRPLALVGPPFAVFLAALGITTLLDPPVRQALSEHAHTFVSAANLISGK
jgi:choline-sulfatase